MELSEFLNWLIYSGGSVMAASWLLERWNWYVAQPSDRKEYLFFAVSALLSVGAYYFSMFASPELLALIKPVFEIVAGLFAALFVGKKFHQVDKA